MSRDLTIKTIIEAVAVLREISLRGGATAIDLQDSLNLSRDKTFRLLATLKKEEMVEDLGDGKYGLGEEMARLWAAFRSRLSLEMDERQKILIETEVEE
ncbi:MAG: hypothetical protein JRC92_06495 [Deltaproteobacteria bacterium]|nr:hypothetical protein [Deltaproteobacteria bacterium]